jgi:hypothetical protein
MYTYLLTYIHTYTRHLFDYYLFVVYLYIYLRIYVVAREEIDWFYLVQEWDK